MAHVEGEVLLCHVQPEFIRRGIGTALMAELENHLLEQGCISAYLNSTQSGRGFYHRLGYRETGQPQHHAGLNVMPMEKSLLHGSLGGWAEGLSAGL
jgi:ribosomal protein S18 acetylase RimI-like enzyme